jgi:kynurenine formamidase
VYFRWSCPELQIILVCAPQRIDTGIPAAARWADRVHRYADELDLAALPLESCVELPAVLARTAGSGSRAVDIGALAALEVAGRAVLLHTGGDAAWGRAGYATDAPQPDRSGRWLAG